MSNKISRRLLLQRGLMAAAAAAAPRALGAGESQGPSAAAPSERLNVAVIGVRSRGADLAHQFARRGDCAVTCICDADEAIGRRFAEQFEGKPAFVQDLRRVMDDKTVDIVCIATPNHWHSLAAIWAMQAGKDVYVEKPVSHHISEGRRMVQAARKYNRICQAGTQYRSSGATHAAAQYVREGKLGRISLAHVCTYRSRSSIGPAGEYPVPASVDYNLWSGPAPMELPLRRRSFHYDWHWFWQWGGGELANNSIHPVDTVRMILGLEGLGRGVLSYGGRVGLDDCGQTPSVQVTVHDFGGLTLVQEVRNLKTADPKHGAILIVGSEGYLAGGLGSASVFDPEGKLVRRLTGPGVDHVENFIRAVRSRRREELNAEIEQGHISTSVVHVANISQRLGRPASPREILQSLEANKGNANVAETFSEIQQHLAANGVDIDKTSLTLGPWLAIDSQRERFIGNPSADAMLRREYRPPFVVPEETRL